jgi:hypothetical protein
MRDLFSLLVKYVGLLILIVVALCFVLEFSSESSCLPLVERNISTVIWV